MLFAYLGGVIYVAAAILTVVKKRQDHAREDLHRRWNRAGEFTFVPVLINILNHLLIKQHT